MNQLKYVTNTSARKSLPTRKRVAAAIPVRHITLPFHSTGQADPLPNETIGAFITRNGWATRVKIGRARRWSFALPTICVVNGQPVLQRLWSRLRIRPGDVVEFWSRPWGKTSGSTAKQVGGIVALIALAVLAPYAAGAISGALFAGSAFATSAITGAILIGGALHIGKLPTPNERYAP